jgi:hypothetical protein
MTEEQYLSERVDDQIEWYSTKSAINKVYHIWSNGLIIFFAALIPFISGIDIDGDKWPQYVTALLGVMTATLTGLSALLKFQEKWTTYRITAESLLREKILYQTRTNLYEKNAASFKSFVHNVEKIMNNENSSWNEIVNRKDGEPVNTIDDTSVV